MADLKISQFTDGSSVQQTDEIATNRAGVNTKVFVGSAAALDVGTGVGDVVQFDDAGGGIPRYPSGDGSQLTNLTLPTIVADDVNYTPTGGVITATNVQDALEQAESEIEDKIENITGLITAGANITLTGAGIFGSPYSIAATVSSATAASAVTYNNATSGLTATNAQTAFDELVAKLFAGWVAYTPSIQGLTGVTISSARSKRTGKNLEGDIKLSYTGVNSSEVRIGIGFNGTNGNVTIDSNSPSGTSHAGEIVYNSNNTSIWYALKEPSVTYITVGVQSAGASGLSKAVGTTLISSATISIKYSVPIQGW